MTPTIKTYGEGKLQGSKWLFRNEAASHAGGAGIILYQQRQTPTFSDTEVRSGNKIAVGQAGQLPSGGQLPFFVGVSCGDGDACASVKPGALRAAIMFDFFYE
ncbi:hypothetical protein [Izhakiella australiensis]|nr:hypothetical protein [Izhakiella australiensis]